MAIASNDSEPGDSSLICAVVRAPNSQLVELEKTIRRKNLTIIQKKTVDLTLDSITSWFSKPPSDDPDIETTCYALQGQDADSEWRQISEQIGKSVCGRAPAQMWKELFPSVVVEKYLLQPASTKKYLEQLKPTLIAGLQEVANEKPDNPLQYLADYLLKSAAQ